MFQTTRTYYAEFSSDNTFKGGPIICRESDSDTANPDKLVFVGVASRNMLSKKEGKPGVFTRIYEQTTWINSKLEQWSAWTECDHTCIRRRTKTCTSATESGCQNGLVVETLKCLDGDLPKYDDVNLSWLPDGYKESVFHSTSTPRSPGP